MSIMASATGRPARAACATSRASVLVEVAAVEQVGQGVADRLIAQSRLERRVCLKLGL